MPCFGPDALNCPNDGLGVLVRDHVIAVLDHDLVTPLREPCQAGLQFLQPRFSESVEIPVSGVSGLACGEDHQRKVPEIAGRTYLVGALGSENGELWAGNSGAVPAPIPL